MRRPRILLDVDGVLADISGWTLGRIADITGRRYQREDITQFHFENLLVTPDARRRFEDLVLGSDPANQFNPMPGAHDIVDAGERLGDVYFVTSPWPGHETWCFDRLEWLRRTFGEWTRRRTIFASDKSPVDGVVLVDDLAKNCAEWEAGGVPGESCLRTAVLYEHPYSLDPALGVKRWPGMRAHTPRGVIGRIRAAVERGPQ